MTLRTLAVLLPLVAASCNDQIVVEPPCEGASCGPAHSGLVSLYPHRTDSDYLFSVVSFKYGTVLDDGTVGNNWDLSLTYGDYLRVNTVTDDQSWIVDLGPLPIAAVPETVDPLKYPVGLGGGHDLLPVVPEHVYFVRNVDSSTRQCAVFRVVDYKPNVHATIQWFRSAEPERFVFPRGVQ